MRGRGGESGLLRREQKGCKEQWYRLLVRGLR